MDDLDTVFALAESMRQVIPVCSILGGFALTAIVVEKRGEPGTARYLVMLLLMITSVSMIGALSAAGRYLHKLETIAAMAKTIFGDEFSDLLAADKLNGPTIEPLLAGFQTLHSLSIGLSAIGICSILGAIAASGFTSGRSTGWGSLAVASLGFLVLLIVFLA